MLGLGTVCEAGGGSRTWLPTLTLLSLLLGGYAWASLASVSPSVKWGEGLRGQVLHLAVSDVSWLCHRTVSILVGPASAPAAPGEFCLKHGELWSLPGLIRSPAQSLVACHVHSPVQVGKGPRLVQGNMYERATVTETR